MPKSFEELSEMPLDSHKPPPTVPKGSYLAGIMGPAENILSSQKQTPGYRVRYKLFQAHGDVDRAELEKFLDEGSLQLTDVEMQEDFYVTERSSFMFADFLKKVLRLQSANFKQGCADMAGAQLIITIGHRPTQRPDGTMGLRADIVGHAPAD